MLKTSFQFDALAFGYPTIPLLPPRRSKLKNIQFTKSGASVSEVGKILAGKTIGMSVSFNLVDDAYTTITKNPNGGYPTYSGTSAVSAFASGSLKWKFRFRQGNFNYPLGKQLYPGDAGDQALVTVSAFSKCFSRPTKVTFTTTTTMTDPPGKGSSSISRETWNGQPANLRVSCARDEKGDFYLAMGVAISFSSPTATSLQGGAYAAICTGKLSKWGGAFVPTSTLDHTEKTKESSTFLKTPVSAHYYNYDNPISNYWGGNTNYIHSTGGFRVTLSDAVFTVS